MSTLMATLMTTFMVLEINDNIYVNINAHNNDDINGKQH
jgi:hypothetical protein